MNVSTGAYRALKSRTDGGGRANCIAAARDEETL